MLRRSFVPFWLVLFLLGSGVVLAETQSSQRPTLNSEFPQKILSPELYRELNDRQFDHLARDLKTLFARSRRVSLPGASHSFLELKGEELSTMNLTQEQAMTLGCTFTLFAIRPSKEFVVSSNKFEQGLSNLNELPSAFRAAIKLFGPIAWFDALALIFWGATLPFFFFDFVPLCDSQLLFEGERITCLYGSFAFAFISCRNGGVCSFGVLALWRW